MFRTSIGDRFRILINDAKLEIDYLSKYLGVSENFIENTDFLSIHNLYLIKKLIPTISEKWLLAGDGNMYEVKAKPSKIPLRVSEDNAIYGSEQQPVESKEVSYHNMTAQNQPKDFSKRIQKLLDYLMLNPSAFAKACGISKNMMVQFWLDGKFEPRPDLTIKFSTVIRRLTVIGFSQAKAVCGPAKIISVGSSMLCWKVIVLKTRNAIRKKLFMRYKVFLNVLMQTITGGNVVADGIGLKTHRHNETNTVTSPPIAQRDN